MEGEVRMTKIRFYPRKQTMTAQEFTKKMEQKLERIKEESLQRIDKIIEDAKSSSMFLK